MEGLPHLACSKEMKFKFGKGEHISSILDREEKIIFKGYITFVTQDFISSLRGNAMSALKNYNL